MNRLPIEVIGIVGYVMQFVARYLHAHKRTSGWTVALAGNALVLSYALWVESYAQIFGVSGFILVNIYGLWRWRRDARRIAAAAAAALPVARAIATRYGAGGDKP